MGYDVLHYIGGYMNKEIEKYVWYYLSVYIVVLIIFAAFQYFGVCEGESLNCKTNWEKVKDILQTTAYIVTPIVGIIGFLSWKEQHNKTTISQVAKNTYTNLSEFYNINDILTEYSNLINHKINEEKKQEFINRYENFLKNIIIVNNEINFLCNLTNDKDLQKINEEILTKLIFKKYELIQNLTVKDDKTKEPMYYFKIELHNMVYNLKRELEKYILV